MKAALDDTITTTVKRHYEPQRIVGDLHSVDRREVGSLEQVPDHRRQAAAGQGSDDFVFADTPINRTLVRDLFDGEFLIISAGAIRDANGIYYANR